MHERSAEVTCVVDRKAASLSLMWVHSSSGRRPAYTVYDPVALGVGLVVLVHMYGGAGLDLGR
jgi:hypothetical protein